MMLCVVSACRLLLAATFIFSGIVKGIDPMGMSYKLNAYFDHWGVPFSQDSLMLKGMVLLLSAVEFIIGIYMLLGIRRRFTSTAALSFMLFMTALTTYIYIYDPVTDCGCFGEALSLTNGQTLAKNILLLLAAAVCFRWRRYLLRLISERNQWITSLYSWIYIFLLGLYSLHYLPKVDFTSFKEGTDLRKAYFTPDDTTSPELLAFDCFNGEEPATDKILRGKGLTLLLTISDIGTADDGCNDRINDIYDACQDSGYDFYALVNANASASDISRWIDRTGASYPILTAETDILRSMVRSNPGLILLSDGIIQKKWSNNNLPVIDNDGTWKPTTDTWLAELSYLKLILWFILPLFVTIFLDRIWVGHKFLKYFIHTKHLKQTIIMRKKIVAGNWKMNLNLQDGVALAKELNSTLASDKPNCDVVICTPFIHLASVANEIDASLIGLGAENCADKVSGAYTGEVSAEMVKSTGAGYVILGHSERRAYYHETPEILKEKINLALANGLKVIFCIGEVLEERESGKQNEVVKAQLEGSLFDLSAEEFKNIILAYEPVWAIGTGKTATAEQAEEMHAFIRSVIAEKFGAEAAENVSILYGGSCKPGNAKEIFAKPNVDGGLIGGAALKVADFKGIIDAWK